MAKGLRYSLVAERAIWAGVLLRSYLMEEAHGRIRIAGRLHPDPNLMIRQPTHSLKDWLTIQHIL